MNIGDKVEMIKLGFIGIIVGIERDWYEVEDELGQPWGKFQESELREWSIDDE